MNTRPRLNPLDQLIGQFDQALRTLVPGGSTARRESPAHGADNYTPSESERRHAAGLMRVNHCGEVCAQALYQGQSLCARQPQVREAMDQAAREEVDHLSWCEERLSQLHSRPSRLNTLWYGMSFGLGAVAGLAGDRWSLGFVAETEDQVCQHLREHMDRLPRNDQRSRAILEQMLEDEGRHADSARAAGAQPLPFPVKKSMQAMAKVMKFTTYRL